MPRRCAASRKKRGRASVRDERAPPFPTIPHTSTYSARSMRTAVHLPAFSALRSPDRHPTQFEPISPLQVAMPSLGRHPRRPRALPLRDHDDNISQGRDQTLVHEAQLLSHPPKVGSHPARERARPRRRASPHHPCIPFHASDAGGYARSRALPPSHARSLHAFSCADHCLPLGRDCSASSSSTPATKHSFRI